MKPYYERGGVRLFLGDALRVLPELPDESVDCLITDPPYSSGGLFRGDRVLKPSVKYQNTEQVGTRPEFTGDNRDQRSFLHWSAVWLGECLRVARTGAAACLFTDWRQLPTTTDALQAGGWIWRGIVPWNKSEAARPQKGRFRAQCEYVVWGSAGPMDSDGECLPGFFEKYHAPGDRNHIAGKPLAVVQEMVRICPLGGVVLDPFFGGAATLLAAVNMGRRAIGIEIEERYCEIAARRLAQEVMDFSDAAGVGGLE